MVFAYVLIKFEPQREEEVLHQIQQLSGITKASLTYGIYDMCIESQLETMEDLDNFIFNQVRKVPGITETVTLIASRIIVS